MLGFVTPHKLILINGKPPHKEFLWRERATFEIHKRFYEEYEKDNPLRQTDKLPIRVASTLNYHDTIDIMEEIHAKYGMFERIICAATGSKMQTVGLYFSKCRHPDIQIEYPTPDSMNAGMSDDVRQIHEIIIPKYNCFIAGLRNS